MKTIAPTSATRSILDGTALTPLFLGCHLDLFTVKYENKQEFMDIAYLIHTNYLKANSDVYTFFGRCGFSYFCTLPNYHITSLVSHSYLEFTPEKQYLVPDPSASVVRRRRFAEAPLVGEHIMADDEIQEDLDDQAPLEHAQPYMLLLEGQAQFRLSPPPAGDDISRHMAWMIASRK
ncbi:unnamed protein product [Arabidopsis halleri]